MGATKKVWPFSCRFTHNSWRRTIAQRSYGNQPGRKRTAKTVSGGYRIRKIVVARAGANDLPEFLVNLLAVLLTGGRVAVLTPPTASPLLLLRGDGLTVRLLTQAGAATTVSGEIARDGITLPFEARVAAEVGAERFHVVSQIGEETKEFTTTSAAAADGVIFRDRDRQYQLRHLAENPA